LATAKDRWLYFVKNAGSLKFIPASLAREPYIHQAFDIANQAGLSDEELEAQEKRFDFIRLQRGSIAKALHDGMAQGREEGLEKGLELGREQGRRRMALEIAAQLLDILDDAAIAAKTGLPETEIADLRRSQ
ncbi:MAG: hypothetical protein PHW13_12190, partial [Methylococcales bacterium]|nr:hypothetical protein [Methylococcales bacterium]